MIFQKRSSLFGMLLCLTILFIAAQLSLFIIHYTVSELVDTLVNTSILREILHPVILLPIIAFIAIQIIAYGLFVSWIWFIAVSLGELFKLSSNATYRLGILFWLLACAGMLSLNNFYFPDSFFAKLLRQYTWLNDTGGMIVLLVTSGLLLIATFLAYIHFFLAGRHRRALPSSSLRGALATKQSRNTLQIPWIATPSKKRWARNDELGTALGRHRMIGRIFLILGLIVSTVSVYDKLFSFSYPAVLSYSKPNIILIGLDSLRPDFTGYFGDQTIHTPNIDHFLQTGMTFTQAYTPLARTFPAWASILTATYPKHNYARNNLADSGLVYTNDTLSKHMQRAGYETIYATDEKRFSNITSEYGFDRIIGPSMGVNDFLLGGLTDFPLSNLLINLSIGRFLFPYNYGNRAANITYEPDNFLLLVKLGLANRKNKPLFLAVHLCLSHWPFTWARDGQADNFNQPDRYLSSVEAVDTQLGKLLQILNEAGLLEHSLVILLSDHGTTLGLPGDRLITEKNYLGDHEKLKWIKKFKLSSAPENTLDFKHDYTMSTAYGQGTDVLSLKQYHVLLAFKGFGIDMPAYQVDGARSLMDIAPTILDFLNLPSLQGVDGVSVKPYFSNTKLKESFLRPLFFETADSISEIETDKISIEKVIKKSIDIYRINKSDGFIYVDPAAEKSIINSKQRAVMMGDWLLARYPASTRTKVDLPTSKTQIKLVFKSYIIAPYFVLLNLKTGQWTVGLTSSFAKTAPLQELMQKFKAFYRDELDPREMLARRFVRPNKFR